MLAAGCASTGLPDNPVVPEYAIPQKDFRLKSGLRVLVQEDHSSPIVVVASVYNAGGTSDPKGVEGLAHFVEHLLFKSRPGGGPMVWDVLKRTGASFNAFTAADVTSYYQIAHKDALEPLMQIEAWRLTHPLDGVTEEMVNTEREVVRNELRQRRETSIGNRTFDEVLSQLFPTGHKLARKMAGTHESLQAATLEHARRFVKEHYRPDNCTIVIAGAVKAEEVAKLLGKWPAEALFGPGGPDGPAVPPRPRFAESPAPQPPPPVSASIKRLVGPVMQPELIVAWSLPGGLRGKDVLLQFAAAAVNTALMNGIEQRYRDELQDVFAFPVPLLDGSLIMVMASLKTGADPEKARTRILDAVLNPFESEVSRRIVQRGKWLAATELLRASGDPVQSALALSEYLAATGKSTLYKDSLETLAAVQPNDLTDLVARYITRARAASVYFEPENDAVAPLAGSGAGGLRGHRLDSGAQTNIAGMGPDEIRRVARVPGLAKLPRFRLPNGLQVVAIGGRSSLTATIDLQIPGGDATVTPFGLAGLSPLLSTTKCRDHGSLTPVGGSLGLGTGLNSTRFFVQVLTGNLENGIAVLSDEVSCRAVYEEAFLVLDEIMDNREERQKEIQSRPQYRAMKQFWGALYPDHPYGAIDVDTAALRKITPAQAESFIKSHFTPDGATAVVVGGTEQEALRAMADKYFGRWAGSGRGGTNTPREPGPGPQSRTITLIDRPAATQTTLQIGCRLAPVTPETLAAHDVLVGVVNEKAWELREQWGATYGIHAFSARYPGGVSHLAFDGAVETAKTGDALKALLDLLHTIGTDGPDMRTFTVKRWDAALEFNTQFASGTALAEAVLSSAQHGWPLDTLDRYPEALASLQRSAVRDVLAPCRDHEVVVMVGRATDVRPQLEAVGLPPTP